MAAVEAELAELGLVASVRGRQALAMAAVLDAKTDTGSALAAVSKELSRVMDEIRAVVPAKGSLLDELAARRDAKRAAG